MKEFVITNFLTFFVVKKLFGPIQFSNGRLYKEPPFDKFCEKKLNYDHQVYLLSNCKTSNDIIAGNGRLKFTIE